MPYLKKAPKRTKIKKKKIDENDKIYHSKKWKALRAWYYANHPLCEICLALGKIVSAEDVHHKDSFNNYCGNERLEKAFDPNNLMSLCKRHHAELHKHHTRPREFDLEKYKKDHPEEFS